jgi:hypothetical protein
MVINISTKNEFIPEWNDNKKSTEPIKIFHFAPTYAMKTRLVPNPKIMFKVGENGSYQGGEMAIEVDNSKFVKEMVISIENLTLKIDGKEKNIKTVSELFSKDSPALLQGLIDEIGMYFSNLLSERDETKN